MKFKNILRKFKKNPIRFISLLIFHLRLISYFKLKFLTAYVKNNFKTRIILFYPILPHDQFVIYKICHLLGYKLTDNLNRKPDLVFSWDTSTISYKDEILKNLEKKYEIQNIDCVDASKKNLGKMFQKAFGYNISINPLKHHGKCVMKPNDNATGVGRIIDCPIKRAEKSFIYQRLVDSENGMGFLIEIRTPIFKNKIPFVYLRQNPSKQRFADSRQQKVSLAETYDIFTEKEIKKILSFCKKMGLDYGELDILRDKKDKRIYIVDANPTPYGPHYLPKQITRKALDRLSKTFREVFMDN